MPTIEEAQARASFTVLAPAILPPEFVLEAVALERLAPPRSPEGLCEQADRVEIQYVSTRAPDIPPLLLTQRPASPDDTRPEDAERITIDGLPVYRRVETRSSGAVLVTYDWQVGDTALTLMTILSDAVTEADLERMIASME